MKSGDYDDIRKVIVTLVLSTDLAHHFPFVEQLKLLHRQMMNSKTSSVSAPGASASDSGSGKVKVRSSTKSIGRGSTSSVGETKLDLPIDGDALGLELSRCSNIDNLTAMKIAIK